MNQSWHPKGHKPPHIARPKEELRVHERVNRPQRGKPAVCYEIAATGQRGRVGEVVLVTPWRFDHVEHAGDKQIAVLASASGEMQQQLEQLVGELNAGRPVTIEPMSRQHIELGAALAKSKGQR